MGRFDLAMGRKSTNKMAIRGVDIREVRFLQSDDGRPPIQSVPVETAFAEAGKLKRDGLTADDCFNWLSDLLGGTMDPGRWQAYLKILFEHNSGEDVLSELWSSNATDIQAAQRVFSDIGNYERSDRPRQTSEEVVHEMLTAQQAGPVSPVTPPTEILPEEEPGFMSFSEATAVPNVRLEMSENIDPMAETPNPDDDPNTATLLDQIFGEEIPDGPQTDPT